MELSRASVARRGFQVPLISGGGDFSGLLVAALDPLDLLVVECNHFPSAQHPDQ